MRPPLARLLAATLLVGGLLGGLLAGCSDSGSEEPDAAGSTAAAGSPSNGAATSTAASPYLDVPAGVELTAPGSALEVNDHAVVAFEPRQDQVGALDVQVTSLERTTFKKSFSGWRLDKRTRSTSPYFVQARIENVGDGDLGKRDIPLYALDGHDTLVQPSGFESTFKPCPSTPFPKHFRHGDQVRTCLVYLVPDHGDLTAVSFRPTEDFDPITWTGKVTPAPSPEHAGGKHDKNGKHHDNGEQGGKSKKSHGGHDQG